MEITALPLLRALLPMPQMTAPTLLVGVETNIPPVLVLRRVRDPLVEAQKLAYLITTLVFPVPYGTPPVLPLVQIVTSPLLMTSELLAKLMS